MLNSDGELEKNFVDEKFLNLIRQVKPKKEYYRQSLGDKLLFINRVDGIKYDILEKQR